MSYLGVIHPLLTVYLHLLNSLYEVEKRGEHLPHHTLGGQQVFFLSTFHPSPFILALLTCFYFEYVTPLREMELFERKASARMSVCPFLSSEAWFKIKKGYHIS